MTVFLFSSPVCYSWEGGKLLAHSPDYDEMVVMREDYEENGHIVCEEKFDIWVKTDFQTEVVSDQRQKPSSDGFQTHFTASEEGRMHTFPKMFLFTD